MLPARRAVAAVAVFDGLSGEEVTTLAVLIALAAEEVFDADDLNVLGNFIVAVGSLMTAAATQELVLTAAREEAKKKAEEKKAEEEKQAADKEFAALKEKVEKIAKLLGV